MIRGTWLYLATRSPRHGAPAFICPVARPTAKSAIKESSVSPLLWEMTTPQLASFACFATSMASVTVPTWLIWMNIRRSSQLLASEANKTTTNLKSVPLVDFLHQKEDKVNTYCQKNLQQSSNLWSQSSIWHLLCHAVLKYCDSDRGKTERSFIDLAKILKRYKHRGLCIH